MPRIQQQGRCRDLKKRKKDFKIESESQKVKARKRENAARTSAIAGRHVSGPAKIWIFSRVLSAIRPLRARHVRAITSRHLV